MGKNIVDKEKKASNHHFSSTQQYTLNLVLSCSWEAKEIRIALQIQLNFVSSNTWGTSRFVRVVRSSTKRKIIHRSPDSIEKYIMTAVGYVRHYLPQSHFKWLQGKIWYIFTITIFTIYK